MSQLRTPRRRRAEAARQADHALLARRLERLGLKGVRAIHVHENRTVLVSVARRGILRVHRGYAYASDRVLRAIIRFVQPRSAAAERRAAERVLVAFPVERYVRLPARRHRPEPLHAGDRGRLHRLAQLHARLNRLHFRGRLSRVRFRLSSRMRIRLGELTVDAAGRVLEIAISRRHFEHDGWAEVEHTVLHEMVHQWQVEAGLPLDHGDAFRRKAREVGVAPTAQRVVHSRRRAARMTYDRGRGCASSAHEPGSNHAV